MQTNTAAVNGGNKENDRAEGDDQEEKDSATSRPPGYQDPPSYEDTIRMSAIKVEDETPSRVGGLTTSRRVGLHILILHAG